MRGRAARPQARRSRAGAGRAWPRAALCLCLIAAAAALVAVLADGAIFTGGPGVSSAPPPASPEPAGAASAAPGSAVATATAPAAAATATAAAEASAKGVVSTTDAASETGAAAETDNASGTGAASAPLQTADASADGRAASPVPSSSPGPDGQRDIRQAVVVIASGYTAKVTLYEASGGAWQPLVEAAGCVGRNGVTTKKREGDMKTPAGMYELSFAFGTERPDTALPFRPITDESYWVDDPDSEYYNTWQEGKKDWKSAEKLSEYPKYYHYAVAVAYNTACTPGRGSAIFLHCKAKAYTSGCIAVPEAKLLQILSYLDPSKKPVILIGADKKAIESYGVLKLP